MFLNISLPSKISQPKVIQGKNIKGKYRLWKTKNGTFLKPEKTSC